MLTRFIGVIILYYIQMIIYYHAIQIIVQMYKSLCCTPVTNMLLYVTYFNVLKASWRDRRSHSESAVPGGVVVTDIEKV